MKHTQYVLVDGNGDAVCRNHQDDHNTPIVAATLRGLISEIAEVYDVTTDYVMACMIPTGIIKIHGDELTIKRQEVTESKLNSDDLFRLSLIKQEFFKA